MKLTLLEACKRILRDSNPSHLRYHPAMMEFEKLIKNNRLNEVVVEINDYYYNEDLGDKE